MHREVSKHLEEILSGAPADRAAEHLTACSECRDQIGALRAQAALVRELKPPAEVEPRPGFYARVMERIEAEGAVSIWNLFVESPFGRRIAIASFALAVVLCVYLVSAERTAEPMVAGPQVCAGSGCGTLPDVASAAPSTISMVAGEDAPGAVLTRLDQEVVSPQTPDSHAQDDDMLVNLVTYREQ